MKFSNELSDAQVERLAILMEEMGEATQAAAKVLRHGYFSYNPTVPISKRIDNRYHLAVEIGHVYVAVDMLLNTLDISEQVVEDSMRAKKTSIKKYLHHQRWWSPFRP
jgi:NTP pyrophosphatase (non-canonical NTP hydrolase)